MAGFSAERVKFRIHLHANFLHIDGQILYSFESEAMDKDQIPEIVWPSEQLPELRTPLNSYELLSGQSLLMMLWARDEAVDSPEGAKMIGQTILRLDGMQKQSDRFQKTITSPIWKCNRQLGMVTSKLTYHTA